MPISVSYSGLTVGTIYKAICAQHELITSYVEFVIGGIEKQTMVEVVGETYIRLVTKFKSAGESRCILVLPGTSWGHGRYGT